MKEHVLNASDRAALQGLIPLAGALGAGTIFALFFGGRRRGSGIAVFELFAIVAVLVSVGTTAYLSISLLHANEAISDKVLTQTATPLIFAVFLLVLVSVLAVCRDRPDRIFSVLLPLALIAGLMAALAGQFRLVVQARRHGADGRPGPRHRRGHRPGSPGLASASTGRFERACERNRFVRLSRAGYRVAERDLRIALPSAGAPSRAATLSCWPRKDRIYLDAIALRRLRDQARTRWDRMAEDKGTPPNGPVVLIRVPVSHRRVRPGAPGSARLWTFEPDSDEEPRAADLTANDDGLFDVTELGIVETAARPRRAAARSGCGTSGRCRRGLGRSPCGRRRCRSSRP